MSEYVTGTDCSRGDFAVSEKESSRIDLNALAADLTAAGWIDASKKDPLMTRTLSHGHRFIEWQRGVRLYEISEAYTHRRYMDSVDITDPVWQHAIDLIRAHTKAGA